MKVAVVGSGISGLVCAYHLSPNAEIHVFEAGDHIGGHTNTLDVAVPSGAYAVDTGFIVFNDRTYPRFIRLMNNLGVVSQPSSMSFSVKVESNGLEYNGTSLNSLFAQRSNIFRPSFHKMIMDILRFNREAPRVLEESSNDMSLENYLRENNYSPAFMDHYIIPMGAAIWSAGVAIMRQFPIKYFVRFFKNHGMLSVNDRPLWRVIKNGSRSYIPALIRPFKDRLHLNAPVRSVTRDVQGVKLAIERHGKYEESRFDRVILAGHADQMLSLLSDATSSEREVLSAFPYQTNSTVLHTDTRVLPTRRRAWASWNYLVPNRASDRVAVTYNMNILQTINSPETFLVSLNMDERIDPACVLKKITYHHPIYSADAVAAQKKWGEISGINNTYYCGAYWGYGFHEDGVVSAERVCEQFGMKL